MLTDLSTDLLTEIQAVILTEIPAADILQKRKGLVADRQKKDKAFGSLEKAPGETVWTCRVLCCPRCRHDERQPGCLHMHAQTALKQPANTRILWFTQQNICAILTHIYLHGRKAASD